MCRDPQSQRKNMWLIRNTGKDHYSAQSGAITWLLNVITELYNCNTFTEWLRSYATNKIPTFSSEMFQLRRRFRQAEMTELVWFGYSWPCIYFDNRTTQSQSQFLTNNSKQGTSQVFQMTILVAKTFESVQNDSEMNQWCRDCESSGWFSGKQIELCLKWRKKSPED